MQKCEEPRRSKLTLLCTLQYSMSRRLLSGLLFSIPIDVHVLLGDHYYTSIYNGSNNYMQAESFVLHMTEGAYFDEDAQGARRVVAHGDEWMNSRLMHQGVEQRIRVEVGTRE